MPSDSLERFLESRTRGRDWAPVALTEPVSVDALPTPALIVDTAAMDRNLARMAEYLAPHGVGLRPHFKMHKTPVIAHRQLALGAIGLCAAKVSEAEVLAAAGIDRVLITSPVASDDKIARVVRLAAAGPGIAIVADDVTGVRRFGALAAAAGTEVTLLVDLDPDMGRTGVARGEPALALARTIVETAGVRFGGLQQYAGHIMHEPDYEQRRARAREIAEAGLETKRLIERDGIAVPVFTGGGTGTFDIDSDIAGVTDIQAGSYVFMDREYAEIGHGSAPRFEAFEPALFVLVTAISRPRRGMITVDGGFKSFATDTVKPQLHDLPGAAYHFGGDEHGIVALRDAPRDVALGERLRVFTPHCDPTVNLYDWMYPVDDDGLVREIWPIAGRGCSW